MVSISLTESGGTAWSEDSGCFEYKKFGVLASLYFLLLFSFPLRHPHTRTHTLLHARTHTHTVCACRHSQNPDSPLRTAASIEPQGQTPSFFFKDFLSASLDCTLFQSHCQERQVKMWGTTTKIAFIASFKEIQFDGLTAVHDTDYPSAS